MFSDRSNPFFSRQTAVIGGVLVFGIVLGGMGSGYYFSRANNDTHTQELRQGGYQYINPLLECEVVTEAGFKELKLVTQAVQQRIDEHKRQGTATHISVYFRDLNNGPWYGIGEQELFVPASLFKVPLMIAYLKLAETQPELLSQRLQFMTADSQGVPQNFEPSKHLIPGSEYTIEELLGRMIAQSDNDAMTLLVSEIDAEYLQKVESDMGVILTEDKHNQLAISVKSYAGIFRKLYNASYLNREMSEKALAVLSTSEFTQGLPAGVPPGTTVAHKFGERALYGTSGELIEKQLHDCGIVYAKSPYLLCVMTRGYDLRQLTGVVRDISAMVYSSVSEKSVTQ